MTWFMLVLPQIIAGLIVAAIAGACALAFHVWRGGGASRSAPSGVRMLGHPPTAGGDGEVPPDQLGGGDQVRRRLLAFKQQPTPDKLSEVETAFQSTGDFISEQMKILEDGRKPVAERRERARDELSKLQSGLSD